MDISIVIPTKNGGKLLDDVLKMIFAQKTSYSYEVICVDSGSSDNTIDIIKQYEIRLYEIKPEEFGHGRTRNYGASLGTGEFIVFITQDALPYDEYWLQNFIDAMKSDDNIAGGFGKHYPYPDCNLPDQNMLINHFASFGETNKEFYLTDSNRDRYYNEESFRQHMAFFSDNNSCLRRSVWESIPYDDVEFAEDQFWARKILEAGYKKIYCPTAAVYHSHNYELNTYKQRYYDEYKAVYAVYGSELSHNLLEYFKGILRATLNDYRYIRKQDLSIREKLSWLRYSLIRNRYRFWSARKAVQYYSLDDNKKLEYDRKYSQQYRQIKG